MTPNIKSRLVYRLFCPYIDRKRPCCFLLPRFHTFPPQVPNSPLGFSFYRIRRTPLAGSAVPDSTNFQYPVFSSPSVVFSFSASANSFQFLVKSIGNWCLRIQLYPCWIGDLNSAFTFRLLRGILKGWKLVGRSWTPGWLCRGWEIFRKCLGKLFSVDFLKSGNYGKI